MEQAHGGTGTIQPHTAKVIAAYAAIYLVWGSTFLAIRYAVESIPPLLTIALRSLIAGALLYGWVWLRGEGRVPLRHWRTAAVGGLCFFGLCHGSLAWAERRVSSGLAAVLLALIPLWVVVLDWLRPGGARPGRLTIAGLLTGFTGLVALVAPTVAGGASGDSIAVVALVFSALAWAAGSVYSRYTAQDVPPATISAMQLLTGGGLLLVASLVSGEGALVGARPIEGRAVGALAYLIVVGSLLTFSAYIWLLRVSSPDRVATYAYVNPVVAVLLGWLMAGEQLTTQSIAAALLIVGGVALIITARQRGG